MVSGHPGLLEIAGLGLADDELSVGMLPRADSIPAAAAAWFASALGMVIIRADGSSSGGLHFGGASVVVRESRGAFKGAAITSLGFGGGARLFIICWDRRLRQESRVSAKVRV